MVNWGVGNWIGFIMLWVLVAAFVAIHNNEEKN